MQHPPHLAVTIHWCHMAAMMALSFITTGIVSPEQVCLKGVWYQLDCNAFQVCERFYIIQLSKCVGQCTVHNIILYHVNGIFLLCP